MKKNRVYLISIAAAACLIFVSVWAIGYSYLSGRLNNDIRELFIEESTSYLSSDEDFKNQYGLLISLESQDKMPIENKGSALTEDYMDFRCVTDRGEFQIRVYHTWSDGWSYRFEELGAD